MKLKAIIFSVLLAALLFWLFAYDFAIGLGRNPNPGGAVAATGRSPLKETPAWLDRFEGDTAVLYLGDKQDKLDLPAKYLPEGVKAGAALRIAISLDVRETEKLREKIRGLQERLKKSDK